MNVAILSDIHDNVWNLRATLEALGRAEKPVDAMICCGDLCSPFIVHQLAEGFDGPIHIAFGNNDGDRFNMAQAAATFGGRVRLHGEFADLSPEELGMRIFVTHYPKIARAVAASGEYGIVCYGHDHRHHLGKHPDSSTLLLNPGAIMGHNPVTGADITPTFVLCDTDTHEVLTIEVETYWE